MCYKNLFHKTPFWITICWLYYHVSDEWKMIMIEKWKWLHDCDRRKKMFFRFVSVFFKTYLKEHITVLMWFWDQLEFRFFLFYRNLRQKRLITKLELLFFAANGRNLALKVLKLPNTYSRVQKVVQLIFCFTVFGSWYGRFFSFWSSSA